MSLTFKELRDQNAARCEEVFHPVYKWTMTDWATALAGEVGEACNFIKKIRRNADTLESNKDRALQGLALLPLDPVTYEDVGKELADVVIYADLLASRLGINLGEAVRKKFNEVSERRHSARRL